MKALRAIRILTSLSSQPYKRPRNYTNVYWFCTAQPQQYNPNNSTNDDDDPPSTAVFDSKDYALPAIDSTHTKPTLIWDKSYRAKADRVIFGEVKQKAKEDEDDDDERERATVLARVLLKAALDKPDDVEEEDMIVKEEEHKSVSVGVIGAPNAGKYALTNFMVGTKVAAVSRKTNTTTHEVLGVMTKGNTQICFYDTPGLMLKRNGFPVRNDAVMRAESAWSSVSLYNVLLVIFYVYRHLNA